MTPQEAIEILEMFLHKQCDLERTKFAYSENTIWIAVNMAKQALEKQIPKKPLNNYGGGYRCPNCQMKHLNPDWVGVKHCDCGQALDWSNN
ncbi:hypothetical protein [uncultured Ruminococcus sp.]|uniref:hypothetical protein n=1 Tax=uncultured Ruminococcus sp. TaxID=165186 RepID=UPI0025F5744B|nr:hypothetical protein [uncultured Ruminococcus sp.]